MASIRRIHALGLFAALTCGAFAHSRASAAETGDSFEHSVIPFLSANCFSCHNEKKDKSELNLKEFQSGEALAQHRDVWDEVLKKIKSGEMPPAESPRPKDADVKAVTVWLEKTFEKFDLAAKPEPGRVTARRLNRAEYNHTLRDLLGVDLRPADDFPQDDSGYGFDRIGDVLTISPVLMEKYLASAERVARMALFGPEKVEPLLTAIAPPFRRKADGGVMSSYRGGQDFTMTDYDFSGLTMPAGVHGIHRFPVEGDYIFKISPGGFRPMGSDPMKAGIWLDGKLVREVQLGQISTNPTLVDVSGVVPQVKLHMPAGEHWVAITFIRQFDGLPEEYGGLNPSKKGARTVATEANPDTTGASQTKSVAEILAEKDPPMEERTPIEQPSAVRSQAARPRALGVTQTYLNKVEILGPYNVAKAASPESLKKVYACGHLDGHHDEHCAHKIVEDFARRAFRRPVTQKEVERYERLIKLAQDEGASFEEGVCLAIQAILVSPDFLFRAEHPNTLTARNTDAAAADEKPAHFRLDDHQLASRLSYFLWSSMPDDELFAAAAKGTLRQPAVLEAQVSRMLADPRSHALVEEFGGQWLQTRGLESVKPDRDKFPDFEDYLKLSMRTETELFFTHIMRTEASVLDFLDAKYTFVNDRLAQHYGIEGVKGPEFRKVDLSETPRRGVITQASVLTVSSYATRTSPVLRGKWILENVLNAPPPPPPPNVPLLDDAKVGATASLREQLERHRENAACASCHARMDPLGIGLENFDGIGLYRTKEGKVDIDASGTLPDGRSFRTASELVEILRADKRDFAQCLTEKMLTYALGRGLERYDKRTVLAIVDEMEKKDYKFSSLVLGIVNSLPFTEQNH